MLMVELDVMLCAGVANITGGERNVLTTFRSDSW